MKEEKINMEELEVIRPSLESVHYLNRSEAPDVLVDANVANAPDVLFGSEHSA